MNLFDAIKKEKEERSELLDILNKEIHSIIEKNKNGMREVIGGNIGDRIKWEDDWTVVYSRIIVEDDQKLSSSSQQEFKLSILHSKQGYHIYEIHQLLPNETKPIIFNTFNLFEDTFEDIIEKYHQALLDLTRKIIFKYKE
ncbi:MAG: hypothetical protein ACOCQR_03640 [bacterium]